MKVIPMGAMILAAGSISCAYAVPIGDARVGGMAGVGVASGDFTRTALNPALLTRFDQDDDGYVQLGLGVIARDYRDTVDDVDDIQDTLDAFELAIDSMDPNAINLADQAIAQLQALDQTNPEGEVGGVLGVYIPSKRLGFGVSLGGYVIGNGLFNFADSDATLIEDSIISGSFDQNDIASDADFNAIGVTELAFSFAREFNSPYLGQFSVGVSPKLQRIDSYFYNATVATFDEDDITSNDNLTDESNFNLDVGFHGSFGQFQYGLVARNLIQQEIRNSQNVEFELQPMLTAGVAYQQDGLTVAIDLDLIEDDSFEGVIKPHQYLGLGLEYDFHEHFQLRAGYRKDLSNNLEDILSVGLGISPGDTVTFDLAGLFGDDDERGLMLQVGVKF